jgi:predicted HAD superfamily Cof-like phosphohydrolase
MYGEKTMSEEKKYKYDAFMVGRLAQRWLCDRLCEVEEIDERRAAEFFDFIEKEIDRNVQETRTERVVRQWEHDKSDDKYTFDQAHMTNLADEWSLAGSKHRLFDFVQQEIDRNVRGVIGKLKFTHVDSFTRNEPTPSYSFDALAVSLLADNWEYSTMHEFIQSEIDRNVQEATKTSKLSKQVREFHDTFDLYSAAELSVPSDHAIRLRARLMVEECFETVSAMFQSIGLEGVLRAAAESIENCITMTAPVVDIVGVADGLADSDYINEGTRIVFGIDGGPVADEVHRSNMAKYGGGRDEHGKVQKPKTWTPPDIRGVLSRQSKKE